MTVESSTAAGTRRASEILSQARLAVALTGAGLSTESGIPDFRSPGGVWEKFQPVYYQDFVASHAARREHWEYKRVTVPPMLSAQPNPGHVTLANLEREGRLAAVITQNIDGLHQRAGSQRVLELHGTNSEALCLQCHKRVAIEDCLAQLDGGVEVPVCSACGGWMKPATVSFGQSLPADLLQEAASLAREADCFFALGSSLLVHPAASLAGLAKESGARLIVVNLTETPYDAMADVVVRANVASTLPEIAAAITTQGASRH